MDYSMSEIYQMYRNGTSLEILADLTNTNMRMVKDSLNLYIESKNKIQDQRPTAQRIPRPIPRPANPGKPIQVREPIEGYVPPVQAILEPAKGPYRPKRSGYNLDTDRDRANRRGRPKEPFIDLTIVQARYKEKWTDGRIAKEVGCSASSIAGWRRKHGLPGNPKPPSPYLDPYNAGLSDEEIATLCHVKPSAVKTWRNRNRLAIHKQPGEKNPAKKTNQARGSYQRTKLYMGLWEQGLSDKQIAKQSGASVSSVKNWRHRHQIPVNEATPEPLPHHKAFESLFWMGMGDKEIAKETGFSYNTVNIWRNSVGLPRARTLSPNKAIRARQRDAWRANKGVKI